MAARKPQPRKAAQADAPKSRGRKTYTDAFKADAVAKARGAQSVAQVASELGVARNTLIAWMRDTEAAPISLLDAVRSGNRKTYLIAWRDALAEKIAGGVAARDMAPLGKQLSDAMRELEEIETRAAEEAADAVAVPDEDLDPDDL